MVFYIFHCLHLVNRGFFKKIHKKRVLKVAAKNIFKYQIDKIIVKTVAGIAFITKDA